MGIVAARPTGNTDESESAPEPKKQAKPQTPRPKKSHNNVGQKSHSVFFFLFPLFCV
jgi:hypothetical protein